jgi:hypothetical protein
VKKVAPLRIGGLIQLYHTPASRDADVSLSGAAKSKKLSLDPSDRIHALHFQPALSKSDQRSQSSWG